MSIEDDVLLAQKNDQGAWERVYKQFASMVYKFAYYYLGVAGSHTVDDLVQYGNIGVMTAVRKFDPRRGLKFSTMVYYWIRHEIWRNVEFGGTIRVPRRIRGAQRRVKKHQEEYGSTRAEAIAAVVPKRNDREALDDIPNMVMSLDAPLTMRTKFGDGGERTMADILPSHDTKYGDVDAKSLIDAAMGVLSDRHRMIIAMRYGLGICDPHTQEEVAKRLGVSRQAVQQMEGVAMRDLRREVLSLMSEM